MTRTPFSVQFALAVTLLFVPLTLHGQSTNYRAQGHYYSAKEQFEAKNYSEALDFVYKAKQALAGTNEELQYLHILSAYRAGKHEEAQRELAVFFQLEEKTVARISFDKTVDRLTNDEIRALTMLINKIDDGASQITAGRALDDARRAALDAIPMEFPVGTSKAAFEDVILRRMRAYNSADPAVRAFINNFKFLYSESEGSSDFSFIDSGDQDKWVAAMSSMFWQVRGKDSDRLIPQSLFSLDEAITAVNDERIISIIPGASSAKLGGVRFDNTGARWSHYHFVIPGGIADPKAVFLAVDQRFGPPSKPLSGSTVSDRNDRQVVTYYAATYTGARRQISVSISRKFNMSVDRTREFLDWYATVYVSDSP